MTTEKSSPVMTAINRLRPTRPTSIQPQPNAAAVLKMTIGLSTGAVLTSATTMSTDCVALNGGAPLSVTRTMTEFVLGPGRILTAPCRFQASARRSNIPPGACAGASWALFHCLPPLFLLDHCIHCKALRVFIYSFFDVCTRWVQIDAADLLLPRRPGEPVSSCLAGRDGRDLRPYSRIR